MKRALRESLVRHYYHLLLVCLRFPKAGQMLNPGTNAATVLSTSTSQAWSLNEVCVPCSDMLRDEYLPRHLEDWRRLFMLCVGMFEIASWVPCLRDHLRRVHRSEFKLLHVTLQGMRGKGNLRVKPTENYTRVPPRTLW